MSKSDMYCDMEFYRPLLPPYFRRSYLFIPVYISLLRKIRFDNWHVLEYLILWDRGSALQREHIISCHKVPFFLLLPIFDALRLEQMAILNKLACRIIVMLVLCRSP
jgi:hypothetical protein